MKLRREMINYLAGRIVTTLSEKELIDYSGDYEGVVETISAIIYDDLSVEDALNDEVKTMLEKMGEELDKTNVNYRKMFQMVKQKLARERGIIL